MSYDVKYNAGLSKGPDNTVGDDNNYETVSGAVSKVGRCVVAEAKKIDGEWIGNQAWKKLKREQDTPTNRQLLAYYTELSLKWLVDNRHIKNLEVSTGDPDSGGGAALLVKFTDVRSGDTSTLGFITPWGKQ